MNGTNDKDGIENDEQIEEHLASCPECSRKKALLDRMIASLKDHKDVFCPEIWQLYDFVQFGEDPSGDIAKHLEHCSPCTAKVEELRAERTTHLSLPPKILEALEEEYPSEPSLWTRVQEFFYSFKMPVLTIATAAALVLVVVIMYPRQGSQPEIGLSSVSWEGNFKMMAPEVSPGTAVKPRVAVIIVMIGFEPKLVQDQIDSLYRALKPNKEMKKKYEFVSPDEVNEALEREKGIPDIKRIIQHLHKDLNVSQVVVITLKRDGTEVVIDSAIVDAKSGTVSTKKIQRVTSYSNLEPTLRECASSVLQNNQF